MSGVILTIDFEKSNPQAIARAAKFMLEMIGFDERTLATAAANTMAQMQPEQEGLQFAAPSAPVGQQFVVTPEHDEGPAPQQAFVAPPTPAAPPVALPPPPPGIEVDAQGVPWDTRIHAGSRAKVADGTWRQKRGVDAEIVKAVMEELRYTMGVERRAPQPPAPPVPQQAFAAVPPVPTVAPSAPDAATLGNLSVPSLPTVAPVMVGGGAVGGTIMHHAMPEVPPVPFAGNAAPPAPPVSSTPIAPVSAGAATGASPGDAPPVPVAAAPVVPPPAGPAPTFPQLMQKITAGFQAKTIGQADILRAVAAAGLTALPMLASRPDLIPVVATELGIAL